jgi:ATP-dependent Clp protease protease subunit
MSKIVTAEKKKGKKKVEEEPVKETEESKEELSEEELQQELEALMSAMAGPKPSPASELRVAQLYGEIDDKMATDIISAFLILKESGKEEVLEEGKEEPETIYHPFELIISTPGGTAVDMFSIYDVMRQTEEKCEIHTYGLGRVMSAGVVLLAAGTKGKRKIGANCRVMIHSVIGGHHGSIENLENEMEEVRWIQEQYNKALCAETDLTPRILKKLLSRNVNVYLTAQEAVEYGIADIIV